MNITFTDPVYLRLLIVVPIIIVFHFYSLNYKRRRALKFANFNAIERVTGTELISKNIVLLYTNVIIAIILICSAAGMSIWYKEPVSTYNYIIAIDSSKSMEANDFLPSRLEVAKTTAINFVRMLPRTTNVGVISFSGSGFIEQVPTKELDKVINAIRSIEIRIIGGTDIGEAVVTGTNLLATVPDTRTKSIILLTDGQLNVGPELSDIIDYAKKNKVVIYTIGMGTLKGGELKEGGFSKIDEDVLSSLAYNTGGKFYLANSSEAIENAYLDIFKPKMMTIPHNLSGFLAILAIFLLVVQWWLSNMKYGGLP